MPRISAKAALAAPLVALFCLSSPAVGDTCADILKGDGALVVTFVLDEFGQAQTKGCCLMRTYTQDGAFMNVASTLAYGITESETRMIPPFFALRTKRYLPQTTDEITYDVDIHTDYLEARRNLSFSQYSKRTGESNIISRHVDVSFGNDGTVKVGECDYPTVGYTMEFFNQNPSQKYTYALSGKYSKDLRVTLEMEQTYNGNTSKQRATQIIRLPSEPK